MRAVPDLLPGGPGGIAARAGAPAKRLLALLGVLLLSVLVAGAIVHRPGEDRLLLTLLIGGSLLALAANRPQLAVVGVFAFLPFLGLLRRGLIPISGWSTHDPLLLVAPILAIALAARLFLVEGRPLAPDRLSKLVIALLLLTLVEVGNPLGGGLTASATGLLYIAAPLLWFFAGREVAGRRTVVALLVSVCVLAVPIAAYGYWQTDHGLPSWDSEWVHITGYAALNVGGVIRAFGTFPSAAEYATYLAMALVVTLAATLHGRLLAVAPIPLLVWALFVESSRGIVVLAFLTVLLLVGLRLGGKRTMLTVLVCGVALTFFAVRQFHSSLNAAATSNDPLVAHQAGGLLHPLDPQQSSLLVHYQLVVDGVKTGFTHPLGSGTGSTNIGGAREGAASLGTEIDVSNEFVSLGVVGGLLFVTILAAALARAISLYRLRRDVAVLAVAAVLFVSLGQWLNGGYYTVSPLVWLLVGWVSHSWTTANAQREADAAAPAPRKPR